VNLIVLLLLAGMLGAHLRGRRFTGGLWLAGAICLKIIPVFLLVFPLWAARRAIPERVRRRAGVGLVSFP